MSVAGRSIVVCRAEHQAAPLLGRLGRQGAIAVHVPLIHVVPPLDGGAALRAQIASADAETWWALTSANGVDALASALEGVRPPGRVAVVGGATADRVRVHGWSVDHEASIATAAGLAASLPPGGRVIAPLAELASTHLVDGLRARDIEVEAVEAYRTITPDVSLADIERIHASDAVLITSPSVVQRLVSVLDPDRVGGGDVPPLIAIGPTSSAAIEAAGLIVADQADHPSVDGLIDAVVRTLTS